MVTTSHWGFWAAILLSVFCGNPALAKLPPTAQRAADTYLRELARVERSNARMSLERLFVLADSLDAAFFPSILDYTPKSGPWTEQDVGRYLVHSVEGLPESEQDSLRTALRGVNVFISDYVFTEPDTKFFLELAKSHGRQADLAFLNAYAGRELGSESVQDCVHFGMDLIVNQHHAWVEFRRRYPRDYVRFVDEEARSVIGELMGTCACGDAASVAAELAHFLKRFPDDASAPQVRDRLATVRNGTSSMTFNCPPPHYH